MSVVAVLGASSDPHRYSYQALELLGHYGHLAIPIHPTLKEVLGLKVIPNLRELSKLGQGVDTLTVYVNPKISSELLDDILALRPRRVIFNPGAENPSLQMALSEKGILVEEACTLVLLRTNQF
jgi:uncharacterized protein